jgi:hypothetical protein
LIPKKERIPGKSDIFKSFMFRGILSFLKLPDNREKQIAEQMILTYNKLCVSMFRR